MKLLKYFLILVLSYSNLFNVKSLIVLLLFFAPVGFSQTVQFINIYSQFPSIPKGILEAVSWSRTHMKHLDDSTPESCLEMPRAFGFMGLFEDGKNYFKENAVLVASLSGISIDNQKASAQAQVMAYASAFSSIYSSFIGTNAEANAVYLTLDALSEIPDSGSVNNFAKDAQIFEVMRLMTDQSFATHHSFPRKHYSLSTVFGAENFHILSAQHVGVTSAGIQNNDGLVYGQSTAKSTQYGPAIWNPAPTCNFSSRSGIAVSAITIHTIQGSYAGAISWSQNCASSVSFHYVIRSSDGQVTQMVNEADKAWHVGSENPYTIGYEHEGYVDDASWYTESMYIASADLSRDITNSGYGIPPLRTFYGVATLGTNTLGACTKIKGHQHFPSQTHTDPGINWNWEKYYKLINNTPTIITLTNANDPFFDSGGNSANYQDDERLLWLIAPVGATSVTLNFTLFNLENNYDYLFIYDGATTSATLIGSYSGTNTPGSITSSGGNLLVEFRSDCATNAVGWEANYTSTNSSNNQPVTTITNNGNWRTSNFDVYISDSDVETSVTEKYVLITDRETTNNGWQSNISAGFACEDFEDNSINWSIVNGSYSLQSNTYTQTNDADGNTNSYLNINQSSGIDYLYSWKQTFLASLSNQRAGLHFMCSDATLSNRGNSYFVFLRETNDQVHIYSVDADVFTVQSNVPFTIEPLTTYHVKATYSPQTGWIKVYINDVFVSSWQDLTPLTSGNSISLRTGNCTVEFDDIKVFQSRNSLVTVEVGATGTMRYESVGAVTTGKIDALSLDATNVWSDVNSSQYLIDRSAPNLISLADGNGSDIDTSTNTILAGNWSFEDVHSSVANYEYCIGSTVAGNDIVAWTMNGLSATMSEILSAPVYDQLYYLTVRATNGAGLNTSNSSDGQLIESPDADIENNHLEAVVIYPNPSSNFVYFKNVESAFSAILYDKNGKELLRKEINSSSDNLSIQEYATGTYDLVLRSSNGFVVKQLNKQ